MEPTNTPQEPVVANDSLAEPIEVKKPETVNPSTQIVINSEDGTISKPSDEAVAVEPDTEDTPVNNETPALPPEEPEQQPTVEPTQPITDISSTDTPVPSEANATQSDVNPMAIPPQPVKKAGAPKAAIVVAILIAVALAAVGVVAYMKMKKPAAPLKSNTQTTNTPQKTPVTTDEVDAAAKDIDAQASKTTGDGDMPTSDSMSDKSLGL